ncbi:hypothetical protein C0993_002286 [Termitomyces sp. T159_Od127]|nr:hypothetical protein C0993_002286 [Termitomyces sp. T159_Od127]
MDYRPPPLKAEIQTPGPLLALLYAKHTFVKCSLLNTGVEARVILKKTKSKAMVDLVMHQVFKEERGAVVLMKRAWEAVEKAREVKASGETIAISRRSLALLMCQAEEGKEGGKGKQKASPPLLPTDKEKKRAHVVSPVVVISEVELEDEEEDGEEARHLAAAIEASKAVPRRDDLAGPSCQPKVPQDVGMQQEGNEQEDKGDKAEKRDKVEVTSQVQPWAQLQYNFRWMSPPVPRITGEAFEWLEKDLVHSVVPLQLAEFLERMRVWAAHMERVLVGEREAVRAELMDLCLRYSTLAQSVEMLYDYQEDITCALEWQEENNVQEGDLLLLHNPSLPSNDD